MVRTGPPELLCFVGQYRSGPLSRRRHGPFIVGSWTLWKMRAMNTTATHMNRPRMAAPFHPAPVYPVALTVWPDPHADLPWTPDAVFWPPDGEPRFGKDRIQSELAHDPALRPSPTGGHIEFSMTEDHAIEQGDGLWHGQELRYLRVWRRVPALGWAVAREVWSAGWVARAA